MTKDCTSVWSNCLQIIRSKVGEQSYNTWFVPIKALRLQETVLTVQVPSLFFYEWIEEHYLPVLRKAIDSELGERGKLEYSIMVDQGTENRPAYHLNISAPRSQQGKDKTEPLRQNPFAIKTVASLDIDSNLNRNFTFDSLVEGKCNQLAISAGLGIAQNPGFTAFNPFLVYGGVGLGKTHLVQAIGNEIKRLKPEKFVQYVQSERFITQFVEALKNRTIQEFTNYYMQTDVLIIDDIEFFAGKEKTQENFFHIFNHLHQSGKQIIMTSDCAPKDLQGLQERLLSRFKWGLTTDIHAPDYETRLRIVNQKILSQGIGMPPEVSEYIARNVATNVRELQGVLVSLVAKASFLRSDISLTMAKMAIDSIVSDMAEERELDLQEIEKQIVEFFKVNPQDLKAKKRTKEIALARQVMMYFCHQHTKLSLAVIGEYLERDHSAVAHASKAVSQKIMFDQEYKNMIETVKKRLKI